MARVLRPLLLVLGALLTIPATAAALPGDAPFAVITPADGASLPTDAGGIPASYSCPVYRVSTAGEFFTVYGGAKDYAIALATAPATDPDGRLAAANRVAVQGGTDVGWSSTPDGVCSGRIAAGGGPPRAQETPGTYWFQVWRICTGCDGSSYEVGPVLKLTLASPAKPELGPLRTAYATYPFLAPLALEGVPTGTTATVERKSGGSWTTAGTATTIGGAARAVVTVPKAGKVALRVRVTLGADTLTSPERTLTVKAASASAATSSKDDGAYRDTGKGIESLALSLTAGKKGRELKTLKATVPMTCPGIDAGTFTTQLGAFRIAQVKVAPDGRFVGTAAVGQSTFQQISGRLRGRKISEGRIAMSVGTCTADRAFSAVRK